jgi:hypothetical protein
VVIYHSVDCPELVNHYNGGILLMSFQDRMVMAALRRGLTSKDFHKGAQSNANSAWFFLLVAGAVFYFQSWQWAVLPGLVTLWSVYRSISATRVALKLEELGQ